MMICGFTRRSDMITGSLKSRTNKEIGGLQGRTDMIGSSKGRINIDRIFLYILI